MTRTQFSISSVKCLLACVIVSVLSGASFRPPAVPLITHDPYFSIWSMADTLAAQATKHWTGTEQSICGLLRIDGKVFRVIGKDPRGVPALDQKGLEVLPTHTSYEFEGDGIHLSLVFFTPALPSNLDTSSPSHSDRSACSRSDART
jgi:Domain of unknown function (DUF4964)